MHSANSGTPESHTPTGNFPVTKHTVAHGLTTVSFTPTLCSCSKSICFGRTTYINRESIELGGRKLIWVLVRDKKESAVKKNCALITGSAVDVRG